MKKARTAGMLKIWYTRLTSYMGIYTFVMLFYLYVIESPLGFQWYHWLVFISLSVATILFIDIKYVFPESNVYSFEKNPEMMKLKKDIREIKRLLKEK